MKHINLEKPVSIWILAGLIFLTNFIFKVYGLQNASLYGDEPFTLFYSQQTLGEIFKVLKNDSNPFLHPVILHFWFKIFGVTVYAGKLYSVILSSLTAALIFKLFYKRFGLLFPLLAAILFSVSGYQYFFAREMRAFAQVGLFAVLSIYFFIEILYEPKKRHVFLLGFTNLCLVMSHYVAFLLPVVEVLAAFMFVRTNRKGFWYFIMSGLFAAVLFAPWFFYTVMHHVPTAGKSWLSVPTWGRVWRISHKLVTEPLVWIHLVFVAGLFPLKFLKGYKKTFDYRLFLFFSGIFWISLYIDFWISQYHPIMHFRYLLFSSIGLFLALAYFIVNIRAKMIFTIIACIALIAIKTIEFKKIPIPENWEHKVERIKKERTKNSLVFINAPWEFKAFSYYYDPAFFRDYKHVISHLRKEQIIPQYGAQKVRKYINTYKAEEVFLVKNQGIRAKIFIDSITQCGFELEWSDKNKFPYTYKFKKVE